MNTVRKRKNRMRPENKVKLTSIIMLIVLVIGILGFFITQDKLVIAKDIIYESTNIPKSFVGYKIMHISDLFNEDKNILSIAKSNNPNVVLVTGNLTSPDGKYEKSVELLNKLSDLYPTYYVLGGYDETNNDTLKSMITATNIEDNRVSLRAPTIDSEKFIEQYIGNRYIKKAEKGDEDAINYIEYIREELISSQDDVIDLSGLPILESNINYIDRAYEVLNLDKEIYQILIMNQCEYSYNIAEADVNLIFTGNHMNNSVSEKPLNKGLNNYFGTSIFINGGIGQDKAIASRFLDYPEVLLITLSDGMIDTSNPLEKFLGLFIGDVKTRFDGDEGFKEYTYRYENEYSYSK